LDSDIQTARLVRKAINLNLFKVGGFAEKVEVIKKNLRVEQLSRIWSIIKEACTEVFLY